MDSENHFVPLKHSMRARLHKIEYAVNWMLENGDWTVDVLPYVGLEELDKDSVDWNDTQTVILDVDGNYMQVPVFHALKHYNMVNEQGEHEPFKLAHFFHPNGDPKPVVLVGKFMDTLKKAGKGMKDMGNKALKAAKKTAKKTKKVVEAAAGAASEAMKKEGLKTDLRY